MYMIYRGTVREARLSSNGNLVDAKNGALLRHGDRTTYATEEAAEKALGEMIGNCRHSWRVLSHEERRCTRCGAVEFSPDM